MQFSYTQHLQTVDYLFTHLWYFQQGHHRISLLNTIFHPTTTPILQTPICTNFHSLAITYFHYNKPKSQQNHLMHILSLRACVLLTFFFSSGWTPIVVCQQQINPITIIATTKRTGCDDKFYYFFCGNDFTLSHSGVGDVASAFNSDERRRRNDGDGERACGVIEWWWSTLPKMIDWGWLGLKVVEVA